MDKITVPIEIKGGRIWLPITIQEHISNKFFKIYIEDRSFITKLTKDGRFFIPVEIRNKLNIFDGKKCNIDIELLESLEKPKYFLTDNYIDLLFFVPEKTLSGFEILILEEGTDKVRLWYSTKGRPNEIILNRFVPLEFVRLLGYYQAEGGKRVLTKRRGRELNFTNTSLDIIFDFISLSKFIVDIHEWKISVRFNENIEIEELANLIKIFTDLRIIDKNIHISQAERISRYTIKLWITNSLIAELIFNCMDEIRKYLANSDSDQTNLLLASYFLQGVIAGDGNIYCVKGRKYSLHPRLCIFESNEGSLRDYSILLQKFGIVGNYVKRRNKNYFIYSGYINSHNLRNVLSYRLLNYSKDNFKRLMIKI